MNNVTKYYGFTLIELMVVVSITIAIGTFAAMNIVKTRDRTRIQTAAAIIKRQIDIARQNSLAAKQGQTFGILLDENTKIKVVRYPGPEVPLAGNEQLFTESNLPQGITITAITNLQNSPRLYFEKRTGLTANSNNLGLTDVSTPTTITIQSTHFTNEVQITNNGNIIIAPPMPQ